MYKLFRNVIFYNRRRWNIILGEYYLKVCRMNIEENYLNLIDELIGDVMNLCLVLVYVNFL